MPIYEETSGISPEHLYDDNTTSPPVWGDSWGFAWGRSWGLVGAGIIYLSSSGTSPEPIYDEN